ncbi:helix-turn-helix domain-containing protein [Pseudonocardia endophytica]|uniref:AraC-like DNA-binding protein n=1 Tax=Pseudonocardia endophytica TaxID=401976 RepID=A0A4R1HSB0_PSEEN|nr:AraC family transcriptional regulator [Pseudonocardia endophytica]TCK20262.1 AraC-like DNA-binding protein [Pseudonocardia endophytica]
MEREATPPAGFDVRSRDPEEANHELRTAYVDFTVSPSGTTEDFEFVHSGLTAPEFALARVRYSMSVHVGALGTNPSLIVLERTRGRLTAGAGRDSVVAEEGAPVLMPTHREGWWVDMDDLDEELVTVARPALDRVATAVGIAPDKLTFSGMTPVSAAAAQYWMGVVHHVRDDVMANDVAAASPLVQASTARLLATAAVTTFDNSALRLLADSASPPGWSRPAALRRALTFIDEHAAEDIGVEDIAAAARIGVRGLQVAFRKERGSTPLEELRRVRMERARRELLDADPTRGGSVAEIAARWGFTNPGRFAVQYRHAYGCQPRDTLRR